MKLRISSPTQSMTDGLKATIERQVRLALNRFDTRIRDVEVRFSDFDGPEGSMDKQCTIIVRLHTGGSVFAQVADIDFDMVIQRAVERITRMVQRRYHVARPAGFRFAAPWPDQAGVPG